MYKLISWNVNGLRAVCGKGFADIFTELDADFFCLQETKMQAGQLDLEFPGYTSYWNYADKKGYSGTAIYTRHEPVAVTYGIGIDEHDHEGRVITMEMEDFFLVCVYTPNSQDELRRLDYRMQWEDDFRGYLKGLEAREYTDSEGVVKHKGVIVCGDLNDSPISYTCKALSKTLTNAYTASGNGPGFSYNRNKLFYRIDHIFHSPAFKSYACKVDRSIKHSDHYPIACHLEKVK